MFLGRLASALVLAALGSGLMAGSGALGAVSASEPSVVGLWQKIDGQTGATVGWFLFVERGGIYEGAIAKLFPKPGDPPNPVCSNCRDDRRNAPYLGLSLIRDLRRNGLTYTGGTILDPRSGSTYNVMVTVSPDGQTLTVRGFLGVAFLGRDEIWRRLPDAALKTLDPIVVAKYLPGRNLAGRVAVGAPVLRPSLSTTPRAAKSQ